MARSLVFEDVATEVDDWYQAHAVGWWQGRRNTV